MIKVALTYAALLIAFAGVQPASAAPGTVSFVLRWP